MKIYLSLLITFVFGTSLLAQRTYTAELSVAVDEVKSIIVNQSQLNVELVFDDYWTLVQGQRIDQSNHIEVTSTNEYEIKVYATSDLIGSTTTIPIDKVRVVPVPGEYGFGSNQVNYSSVQLSTQEQAIVSSNHGDVLRSFSIAYEVSGLESFEDLPSGVYSTTITYSIVSK
ncbi:MAG TPA: hypothetical protein VFD80_08875 [Flavobacteriaceae bacterium]|nr:hypothetical protein [Flavobacteriaceae bacterium]